MNVEGYIESHLESFWSDLLDLLRIPSISALPEHAADVRRAAEWVAHRLKQTGVEHVQVMETGGHPAVYGDWLHAGERPTILIYGHFDTQPVDPIELWEHPPFEPHEEGDCVYARGASDNKGNLLIPIAVVEAFLQTEGALPVNIKFLFEGQEEIGSPHMPDFIAANKERLACHMVLNSDIGQFSETQPALVVGLRGICGLQIDVRGPNRDVHSGSYGGAIQNPLHALAELLASMRNSAGKILVQGFYKDVRPLTEEERAAIAAVPFDEEAFKADLGINALHGEPGYSTWERIWARPTLEVNGLWGGFIGEGTKTIIPSEAHAKITCRLVPDQEPAQVIEAIRRHVARHTPPGVTATVKTMEHGSKAFAIPLDHPGLQAARQVLRELYGREPYLTRAGGSVPITTAFKEHLGAYAVSFGFGLPDERQHSPNEFFRKSSFRRGLSAYGKMLTQLAALSF